jgi:Xaa-Pro aminopeptidase
METQSALAARRAAVAKAWDLRDQPVLIAAGPRVPIAGTDQSHAFHAHPEFRYLAGLPVAGAVVAFHPVEGWALFAPVPSQEDRVWSGDGVPLDELAATTGIDRVKQLSALPAWLESHRSEPIALLGNHDIEHNPSAYGLESWRSLELEIDRDLSAHLSELMSESRRAKDSAELARMRAAADASRFGHFAALKLARPGMTERDLQVELEAEFFRQGSERTAYGSIVGSGPNAAILHIAPSLRALKHGDLVLVDAAAEFDGYAADITRTFPVAPAFSSPQRDLYQLVLEVQEAAIADVKPGVEYKDLHLAASTQIAQGLVDLGILRGNAASLVERDVHALFFPHGLGHMLGLSTHDAGGCLAGRTPSERFGLKWLRADLPLQENYVVTIEPGIYFIPALLDDPERRAAFADAVDWQRVDALRGFGGIRIEDDVLVTPAGSEVLSAAIPKSVEDIEAIRREALSE